MGISQLFPLKPTAIRHQRPGLLQRHHPQRCAAPGQVAAGAQLAQLVDAAGEDGAAEDVLTIACSWRGSWSTFPWQCYWWVSIVCMVFMVFRVYSRQ